MLDIIETLETWEVEYSIYYLDKLNNGKYGVFQDEFFLGASESREIASTSLRVAVQKQVAKGRKAGKHKVKCEKCGGWVDISEDGRYAACDTCDVVDYDD